MRILKILVNNLKNLMNILDERYRFRWFKIFRYGFYLKWYQKLTINNYYKMVIARKGLIIIIND